MNTGLLGCQDVPAFWNWVLKGRNQRPVSIRQLSSRLKYSSDRSIGMAVSGQRQLGPDMAERLAQYLKLSDIERTYLTTLALRDRAAKRGLDLDPYETRLAQLRGFSEYIKLSAEDLQKMGQWYYLAILELVSRHEGMATLDLLECDFAGKVSRSELIEALAVLTKLGMICETDQGRLKRQASGYYKTPTDVPSQAIRQAHKNMLQAAASALDEQSILDREFQMKVFAVARQDIPRFKSRLKETLESLSQEFIDPNSKAEDIDIYQLGVQFFRLAKVHKK